MPARLKATLLDEYRRKRDPARTPEPFAAGKATRAGALQFVVQKHAASRLHFDLRLELDGVLKSWAVPKGPSLRAGAPRLAIAVEDHPLEYGNFEGVIPAGQYGGGTVQIWDRGTWTPMDNPRAGLKRGSLAFELEGQRLKGRWRLVRQCAKGESTRPSTHKAEWLLLKGRDAHATSTSPDSLAEESRSVVSGRTIAEIAATRWPAATSTLRASRKASAPSNGSRRHESGAAPAVMPEFIKPQLATLASEAPSGRTWLHETKLDGYRLLCVLRGSHVRCLTRNRLDWTDRFPTIVKALAELDAHETMLDGEVVVFDDKGRTDFHGLQRALKRSVSPAAAGALSFVAFDMPWRDGVDLRDAPLLERKAALTRLLRPKTDRVLRLSDHISGNGPTFAAEACRMGLEGIISKRADAPYRSGRSRAWLKIKCGKGGEFAVCGMTAPRRSRGGFGSLLLARPEGDRLVYCGRVGAGFSEADLKSIANRLQRMRRKDAPCEGVPRSVRPKLWCEPRLVVEVSFAAITTDGLLRQPVFKALRDDKEVAELTSDERAPSPAPEKAPRRSRSSPDQVAGVKFTHPDRLVFESPPVTKLELARYYELAAPRLLPFIAGRPLALLRCPDGDGGPCFFQKHFREALPQAVRRVGSAASAHHLVVDDVEGLVSLVQRGVIEFHVWASRADRLDHPEYLVLDLDPGPGVTWDAVRDAARLMRSIISKQGLTPLLRTTGGNGLHVVAYLPVKLTWEDLKALTKAIASTAAAAAPDRLTTVAAKVRRQGRIYIDYLRNGRGATAIANYSARARTGAPVAMPIAWAALGRLDGPAPFTVPNMLRRLHALPRDWREAIPHGRLKPS
jgi:bifunctional non-homologous end joining protein LigD